jgi:DNA-directed RNA polymerase specialized sigma subunit
MVFHSHSLDAPLYGQEDPASLSDMIGEEDPQVEHTLDMESVLAHWNDLPEREQRILTMRFYGNMTQARSASGSASPRCTSPGCSPARCGTCGTACSGTREEAAATQPG